MRPSQIEYGSEANIRIQPRLASVPVHQRLFDEAGTTHFAEMQAVATGESQNS
jgi:hypothetical protein